MFDNQKPTSQVLGRFQPFHDGHLALFKKSLEETGQVCIMIRDMPEDENNPFHVRSVRLKIEDELTKHGYTHGIEYIIMVVPNIVDISYGRDVGYTFTKHDLGEEIHQISATNIRKVLNKHDN